MPLKFKIFRIGPAGLENLAEQIAEFVNDLPSKNVVSISQCREELIVWYWDSAPEIAKSLRVRSLEAEVIVLKDSHGQKKALLGVGSDPDGRSVTSFILFDEEGKQRFSVGVMKSVTTLTLNDPIRPDSGCAKACLAVHEGMPVLEFSDSSGSIRVKVRVTKQGAGICISDSTGRACVLVQEVDGVPRVDFLNKDGSVVSIPSGGMEKGYDSN